MQRILKEEWVIEGEDGAPPFLDEIDGYTFRGWDMGKTYTDVYSLIIFTPIIILENIRHIR